MQGVKGSNPFSSTSTKRLQEDPPKPSVSPLLLKAFLCSAWRNTWGAEGSPVDDGRSLRSGPTLVASLGRASLPDFGEGGRRRCSDGATRVNYQSRVFGLNLDAVWTRRQHFVELAGRFAFEAL
jgi:hypothetical protein